MPEQKIKSFQRPLNAISNIRELKIGYELPILLLQEIKGERMLPSLHFTFHSKSY